jgi:hypothetical protein
MARQLNIPRVPLKTKSPPKDAAQDPSAKHYAVVLRAGAGHQPFTFSMDNDFSACIAALFLGLQYFPNVHTLEVYRKGSGDPNVMTDVGEGICKVPMSQLLKFAAPFMEKLTGLEVPSLVTPIDRAELGTTELSAKAQDAPRGQNRKKG